MNLIHDPDENTSLGFVERICQCINQIDDETQRADFQFCAASLSKNCKPLMELMQMLQTKNHSHQEQLISVCIPFLEEVKDLTTGTEVELWLNDRYGMNSAFHQEVSRLIKIGVFEEGWAANVEITGPRYRRARMVDPSEKTFGFSITCVYLDSTNNDQNNPEGAFRGEYHTHPYGEFNMVIPVDKGAAIMGPNGWCHGGWTAPPPGSHHYPEVKGGALIALFFLPAGRISYKIKAPDAQ